MNIYLITRTKPCNSYDVYDGAVVYAETAAAARNMHPADGKSLDHPQRSTGMATTWPVDPKDVAVKYLGIAPTRKTPGIITTDFKAA